MSSTPITQTILKSIGIILGSGFVLGTVVVIYQNFISQWFSIRFEPDLVSYNLLDNSKGYVVFHNKNETGQLRYEHYQFLEYEIIPYTDLKNVKVEFTFDTDIVVVREGMTCRIYTPECRKAEVKSDGTQHYRFTELAKLTKTNRAIVTLMVKKKIRERGEALFKQPTVSIEREKLND